MRTTRAFRLRRLAWRVRRNVPRAIAQPLSAVLPELDPPRRPIFLIGCPRSGTTILLRALLESPELRSVQAEGHILWDAYHHPRERGWDSDARSAGDVLEREREYVYCAIRLFTRGRRFVDKTPANCLRVPYLHSLFPDATFVFLRRRAAGNVNSLIEAWRARPRFVRYTLPEPLEGIEPLDGRLWSLVLVPGWRDLRTAPLEEVCARQYVACNEAALDAREAIDPSRWVDVSYEDLVASPVEEVTRLYERLEIPVTARTRELAARLSSSPSPTSLTPPKPEKWREQNRAEIERILPSVAETERRLGYEPAAGP